MPTFCSICHTLVPVLLTVGGDKRPLCPTCMRFARLALSHGYTDWLEAVSDVAYACRRTRSGCLLEGRWSAEELAILDKMATLRESRQRRRPYRMDASPVPEENRID